MYNFKFHFSNFSDTVNDNVEINADSQRDWSDSVKVIVPSEDKTYLKVAKSINASLILESYCIKYLTATAASERMKNEGRASEFLSPEGSPLDLVPGVYEGGFKVWECSLDLIKYLHEANCLVNQLEVIELGCGSGLPGLLAYHRGCDVTFQDFNKEVLEYLTIPNVILNTPDDKLLSISEHCTFLSGHWQGIKERCYGSNLLHKKYDVILTAETIYNKSYHRHLLELMKIALKPKGTIYLAAKTHYFGVGGTLSDFIALIEADGSFEAQVVFENLEGVQRKIITLQFASDDHQLYTE